MDNDLTITREGAVAPDRANRKLKAIADRLVDHPGKCGKLGMNGMAGIVIFLFHYARCSSQIAFEKSAATFLEEALECAHNKAWIGYADGLAGLGCSILYLSKNGFINSSTAEYFRELDHLIYGNSQQAGNVFLNSLTGITGSGKYYIGRLSYAPFQTAASNEFNAKALSEIVDKLDPPYASYSEIIHAIDILGEIYSFDKGNYKAKDYLDYSLDKLETMKYEDIHFCNNSQVYDDLKFSLALLTVSQLSGDLKYRRAGMEILENDNCWKAFKGTQRNVAKGLLPGNVFKGLLPEDVFKGLSPQRLFLYHNLAHKVNNKKMQNEIIRLLGDTDFENQGLINGDAGLGMHLLTATGAITPDWFNLIPIVY